MNGKGIKKVDKLKSFLGLPELVNSEVKLYSPKINEIAELGEGLYSFYVILLTFNAKKILKFISSLQELEKSELMEEIENMDDYVFITSIDFFVEEVEKALSFFAKKEVKYEKSNNNFVCESNVLLDASNYKVIAEIIKDLNVILEDKEESAPKFRNKRAKELYERMQKYKQKSKEGSRLSLKDILSILCYGADNGINIFNVGELTIYQVYEQFERLGIKDNYTRILLLWSNTYQLKEHQKLDDWMVKTKL